MSQYGAPFDHEEPWVCGALDLSIETLTGTAFELRVSPSDTILSIKTKIQRYEGIPVSQQHLLYNLVELDNSSCVKDYAIQNGATLKLILSMRGGPISTRRLPSGGEAVWRELEDWMNDNIRVDSSSSSSRMIVLVSRDGDKVNLVRIMENDDGTYSPLPDSLGGSSLRNLFSDDDPLDSARRLEENSVTMRKMEELMENMKQLSITKKDKKSTNSDDEERCGETNEMQPPESTSSFEDTISPLPLPELSLRKSNPLDLLFTDSHFSQVPRVGNTQAVPMCARPPWKPSNIDEGASCSNAPLNNASASQAPDGEGISPSIRRPITLQRNFVPGLRKAKKEAENIIRLQSKSLSVVIDSPSYAKRSPLPELRRTQRLDLDPEDKKPSNNEELREKTASRMSTSSFAIVEEENDMSSATSGICSSQSSLMALPSNDDVVVSFSSISRNRVATSVGGSRFRVSHYVVDSGVRPKSTPSPVVPRETKIRKQILSDCLPNIQSVVGVEPQLETASTEIKSESAIEGSALPRLGNSEIMNSSRLIAGPFKPLPPPAKKRPRCLACRKRLNITNTHTCRCGGVFCSVHRYSETHDCHFDYKKEGKTLLRLANPLVTAPKLPKL